MSDALARVHEAVAEALARLAPSARLTFVMRLPGNDDADLIVTDDDLAEVAMAVARQRAHERPPAADRAPAWWRERVTALLAAYRDDPEHAHALEDDMLWEVIRDVAGGADMREVCTVLVEDLEQAKRRRWHG